MSAAVGGGGRGENAGALMAEDKWSKLRGGGGVDGGGKIEGSVREKTLWVGYKVAGGGCGRGWAAGAGAGRPQQS
jgi:hypothetical protein